MLFATNSREDYVVLNYLHSQIMMGTGGPWGQRDAKLTRSAVTRPFRTAFGEEIYADVFQKAAALLDAIANRVVFKDGNKRTAYAAAVYYLRRNGERVIVDRKQAEAELWYVVLEHPPIDEIADWFRSHTASYQVQAAN